MANEWIDDRFDIFMRPVEGGSSEHDDRIAELEAMVIDDSWGELRAEGIRAREEAITWLREEACELRKAERNAAELEEKLRIEDEAWRAGVKEIAVNEIINKMRSVNFRMIAENIFDAIVDGEIPHVNVKF